MKPSVCVYIEMNGKAFHQKKQRASMKFPTKSINNRTKALTISIDWIIMTQDKAFIKKMKKLKNFIDEYISFLESEGNEK